MRAIALCVVLMLAGSLSAALTKTETTEALGWTLVEYRNLTAAVSGTSSIKETGSIDVSDCYGATLHIDACLADSNACEGMEITVLTASEASVDGSWSVLTRFVVHSGKTGIKVDCNDANSSTTVYVTNPTAGNFNHNGKQVFKYDTATIANSEILYQIGYGADTGAGSDRITVLNAPDHATDTDCDIISVDGDMASGDSSAVYNGVVSIPITESQVNVIFNNFYDTDGTGADMVVRVRVPKVTALN